MTTMDDHPRHQPRTVAVVPHTHWDREWYSPFQTFRLRLVDLLDEFLPRLEADGSFAHFLLDGQMAVVDDYLAIRPEAEPVLRRLAAAGRLAVGPWYILMDEFLVSGETIVRNLQLGLERAAGFGGAMAVGYLPDMFGHIAQMPQLLRLAGLDRAVVWRGVPAAVDRTGFWWRSPDGSTVRAEYLPVGYGNGAAIPDNAKALVRRVAAHETEVGQFTLGPDSPMLWMNGTDHQTPQPWLGAVLAEANAMQDDYRLVVSSLAEYLAQAPAGGLPSWDGELRSGARANLLMGVASNRVDVKQAAARAERALEREAEPLCALWLPAAQWPDALLGEAWREVIRNSAHDSICACSADEVGAAVLNRFAEATGIADGLRVRALRAAGCSMAGAGPVVVNPSARDRSGVVELTLVGDGPVEGGQVLSSVPAKVVEVTGPGGQLNALLGGLMADGDLDAGKMGSVELTVGDTGVDVVLRTGGGRPPDPRTGAAMAELWAQAGAHRDQPMTIRVERAASQRVAVHAAGIAGFGWSALTPQPLTVPPVTAGPVSLGNGFIDLTVDPRDGTFALAGTLGLDRLVDDGDEGDTYNYSPPPSDVAVDQPITVAVAVVESGPVRGRLRVARKYRWPERVVAGSRTGEREVKVVTDLEVRAGEELVRVTTSFDNPCRDHRLRSWFPLPVPATFSQAECAFAVVTRGLSAEGGPHEFGLPTFPARRFVSAGGLTITHEGLLEYELVDEGRSLALTLLRATGMLSRDRMAYRSNPAGPALPVEGPQMRGRQVLRYCVHVGDGDPYALADQAWLPLEVVHGSGAGDRPAHGRLLSVTGAEVSALYRVGGSLTLRVFNPTDHNTTVGVEGRSGWLVDLRGQLLEPFEQSFPLRPWGIATAQLRDPPG
jgi:mannosylglycerate hydrolase